VPDCQQSTIKPERTVLAFSDVSTPDVGALFDRVPKATLRAHVVERLRGAILAGDIPPGAPLVETALSEPAPASPTSPLCPPAISAAP
jgi:hypothetical protein